MTTTDHNGYTSTTIVDPHHVFDDGDLMLTGHWWVSCPKDPDQLSGGGHTFGWAGDAEAPDWSEADSSMECATFDVGESVTFTAERFDSIPDDRGGNTVKRRVVTRTYEWYSLEPEDLGLPTPDEVEQARQRLLASQPSTASQELPTDPPHEEKAPHVRET